MPRNQWLPKPCSAGRTGGWVPRSRGEIRGVPGRAVPPTVGDVTTKRGLARNAREMATTVCVARLVAAIRKYVSSSILHTSIDTIFIDHSSSGFERTRKAQNNNMRLAIEKPRNIF